MKKPDLQKLICTAVVILYGSFFTQAQNSVGIGIENSNPNAVLELVSPGNNQGLLVPRLTTAQRTAASFTSSLGSAENGLLVYDSDEERFYFWIDNQWIILRSGTELVAGTGIDITGNTISNTGDADADPANEIQDLDLSGNSLSISGDPTPVDLSGFLDNTDTQALTFNSGTNEVSISGGNTVDLSTLVDDADADPANEIQDLSVSGNNLNISGGTGTQLSPTAPAFGQVLKWDGAAWNAGADDTGVGTLPALGDAQLITNNGTSNIAVTVTGDITFLNDGSTVINPGVVDASKLNSNGASTNEILKWDGAAWQVATDETADADADPINEIQDLELAGNSLTLTADATPVDLSAYVNTDSQDLSLTANTLSLTGDATTVDLSGYLDNTDAQDLDLAGNSLSLTGDATPVDLSSYVNTDNQDLSLAGNTLSLTNDATTVNLAGYLDNTDSQDLTLTANTLSLTGDATTVDLSGYLDNTDAQDLELAGNTLTLTADPTPVDLSAYVNTDNQDLTLTANTLSLTGDATTVDLTGYLDNTDNQDLSLAGNTLSLTGDATTVDLSGYLDNTDAQDLELAGNTLTLTADATPVDLSAYVNTDNQDLTLTANTLSLTGDATTVNLAGYLDNTDNQDLSLAANTLSLTGDATTVDLSGYLDNTDAQDLDLVANSLTLTGDATPVDLSTYVNTDNQDLSLAGNTLSLTNDATTVNLAGYLDNTDNQDLSLAANTLSLTGDATTVDLSGYLDNTDAQDLDLAGNSLTLTGDATPVDLSTYVNTDNQDLSLAGNTLSLTNDATTVNLAGYLDNTDNQDLSLTGNTLSLTGDATPVSLAGYLDNTDNQDLSEVLGQGNDAGGASVLNVGTSQAGSFIYTTPVSRFLSVDASSFVQVGEASNIVYWSSAAFFWVQDNAGNAFAIAPLNFPDGVQISRMGLFVEDSDGSQDIRFELQRYELDRGSPPQTIASGSSSGASAGVQEIPDSGVVIPWATVDNTTYTYQLRLEIYKYPENSFGAILHKIYSARIEYLASEPN